MTEDVVSVVKWVLRLRGSPSGVDRNDWYYTEDENGKSHTTDKLSEAKIYDVKYLADTQSGFELIPVTKKQLFEARLKDK